MEPLNVAYNSVLRKWRKSAPADVVFTGSVMCSDFYTHCGQLDDGYEDDIYEVLRAAYPSETELMAAIDRVGRWFERRIKTMDERDQAWSRFEEVRVRVRALNRAMNDMLQGNRKQQVLTVLIAYELTEVSRVRN